MNLIVLTPEKKIFEGEVKAVKVPGAGGQFEVLKDHAAIVSSLTKGPIRITKKDGSKDSYNISGGFIEVLNNEISLLVTLPTEQPL